MNYNNPCVVFPLPDTISIEDFLNFIKSHDKPKENQKNERMDLIRTVIKNKKNDILDKIDDYLDELDELENKGYNKSRERNDVLAIRHGVDFLYPRISFCFNDKVHYKFLSDLAKNTSVSVSTLNDFVSSTIVYGNLKYYLQYKDTSTNINVIPENKINRIISLIKANVFNVNKLSARQKFDLLFKINDETECLLNTFQLNSLRREIKEKNL